MRYLDLRDNKLTSLPAEVGNCLLLERLFVGNNELTALPDDVRASVLLCVWCSAFLTVSRHNPCVPRAVHAYTLFALARRCLCCVQIGKLRFLVELQAQNNKITAIPDAIKACGKLTLLHMGSNQLTELPGDLWESLPDLKELYLYKNTITACPPEIGSLTKLEILSLAGNKISSLPDTVGNLTMLREVYMGGNPMSEVPPTVGAWTEVQEVSFRGAKLKSLPECVSRW